MGLFNKLFGQKDKLSDQSQFFDLTPYTQICKTKQELIERYGGIALSKQSDLQALTGTNDWKFSMETGMISFGDNLIVPVQILGTFSHESETWLWAWANEESGVPPNLLTQTLQLKTYGKQNGIEFLYTEEFDATNEDLHLIGLIASGMFDSSGYYLANYGQGTLLVNLKSDEIDQLRKDDFIRISNTFTQLISTSFITNHKSAFINYVIALGYHIDKVGSAFTATKDKNFITADFDNLNRLKNITGTNGS